MMMMIKMYKIKGRKDWKRGIIKPRKTEEENDRRRVCLTDRTNGGENDRKVNPNRKQNHHTWRITWNY